MDRRLLAPAEAALLLAPKAGTAAECVQAGLLSLLSSGRIGFDRSRSIFKESALLLHPGADADAAPLPGHLQALDDALRGYAEGGIRLKAGEVLHALQRRFGHGFAGFVHDQIAPGLIRRGLLVRRDTKVLRIFPRIVYERTPAGEALTGPLKRLMAAVDAVPSLIDRDPDQALRLARSAGVPLVMSPRARRKIPKLRKLLAARDGDPAAIAFEPIENEREAEWQQVVELGDMALAFDVAALFDGLDAAADFTSDGGGSSGDGDGGGGGGD